MTEHQVTLDVLDEDKLLDALVELSEQLMLAYFCAKRSGQDAVAHEVRSAGIDVADAIALLKRPQHEERTS